MVKKRKKKNAITLLALVITIVIMLLLAGVAIQMTMGENGLIAKSVQAQKEQAKAELYDTAKLSYMSLNAKALENGQPSPQVELALSTTEFRDRYDIVGDDVTDKNGNVIDSKDNLLNTIKMLYPPQEISKNIGGVEIPPSDKDKLIIKINIKSNTTMIFGRLEGGSYTENPNPVRIEYEDGTNEMTDLYSGNRKEYSQGNYIVKFVGISDYGISGIGDYDIEVLQWGNIADADDKNILILENVSKIYEPEPDKVPIRYGNAKFTEIPEWLFSKKVTSTRMSQFYRDGGENNIEKIPKDLFKNCINAEDFSFIFDECIEIKEIPEDLFKYNTKAKNFIGAFRHCKKLKEIPRKLFKNNPNVESFTNTFYNCYGLTNIPSGLFANNVNVLYFTGIFDGCIELKEIPSGLFENNTNVLDFSRAFSGCGKIKEIPNELFKNNVNVVSFMEVFSGCREIKEIPEKLFENNVKVKIFQGSFAGCKGLIKIPENAFKYNENLKSTYIMCAGCEKLTTIPNSLIDMGKKVQEKGGNVTNMFIGCTSASNYNSIPNYLK